MAAPFTSTIGTGGTYSTLAAWLADMPTNITASGAAPGNYSALLKNQTFTSTGTHLTLTGITTDATHGITIGCEAGASFRDHANAATNPLRPDGTKGALLVTTGNYFNALVIQNAYVTLAGLQVDCTGSPCIAVAITNAATNFLIDACLLRGKSTTGSNAVATLYNATTMARNSVMIQAGAAGNGIRVAGGGGIVRDCTILRPSSFTAAGVGVSSSYSGHTLTGNAIFGFATATSGTLNVASDYNATDQATLGAGYPGTTHNLTSLTYSSQFENTGATAANIDARLKSGANLIDAGTAISGITADIIGQARTTPDIGAWEYSSGATATTYTLSALPTSIATGGTTTATVTPDSTFAGVITITPTGTAAVGLSAATLTFTGSASPQTTDFTPTVAGTLTLTGTNDGALTDPAAANVAVDAADLEVSEITCEIGKTALDASITVTGGTPPYTKQWSYATSQSGTYNNVGTDSLSLSLAGLTYRTPYWLKCVVVDSAGSPATVTVGPTGFATRPPHSIALGFIGDSITGAMNTGDITTLAAILSDSIGASYDTIPTPDGRGVGSTKTADWLPSAANWVPAPVSNASNCYNWATASFASTLATATVKIVHIMLGTNDAGASVPASTYGANLATIANGLVGLGYRVVLSCPPFHTGANVDLVLDYAAQIPPLVDNVNIFQGDQDAFLLIMNDPDALLTDGVHPTVAGRNLYGKLWADAINRVMEREGRAASEPPGGGGLIGGGSLSGGLQ